MQFWPFLFNSLCVGSLPAVSLQVPELWPINDKNPRIVGLTKMEHWQVLETEGKEVAIPTLAVSYFGLLKQQIDFQLAILFGVPLT